MNKIEQAKKLYGKIQGVEWCKEHNYEYKHYDAIKKCEKVISETYKEIEKLKLTAEEDLEASNNADMKEADYWYGRY